MMCLLRGESFWTIGIRKWMIMQENGECNHVDYYEEGLYNYLIHHILESSQPSYMTFSIIYTALIFTDLLDGPGWVWVLRSEI